MRPAECLTGIDLPGGWKVLERIRPKPTATGGQFSVGYKVENVAGRVAFLKALDFSKAMQTPDPARELQAMTGAYNFERDLLAKCKGLTRIVTPLADGTVMVPGNFGPLGNVCYLIFECARGDIRNETAALGALDLAWCLRSLHQTAVGLRQLHLTGIAHQDLKPSNLLCFDDRGIKITDLGRACDVTISSPTDSFPVPGDVGYAPPEQFYPTGRAHQFGERCLADLYHFGSLVFFYFSNCSATQAIRLKLQGPRGVNLTMTDFAQDLPYIRQAFQEALGDLERAVDQLGSALTSEIVLLAQQLCEPDPSLRGDPKTRGTLSSQHCLVRYVSRFDLLASKAEHRLT